MLATALRRTPDAGTDYRTPALASEVAVSLRIDGRAVIVPAGTSLLRATPARPFTFRRAAPT